MVKSEEIRNKYLSLLKLILEETKENPPIKDYLVYVEKHEKKFSNPNNVLNREELREFTRGANRFSDEFIFSKGNYPKIRLIINELYELLDSKEH